MADKLETEAGEKNQQTVMKPVIEKHGPGYLYRDDNGKLQFVYDSDEEPTDNNTESKSSNNSM